MPQGGQGARPFSGRTEGINPANRVANPILIPPLPPQAIVDKAHGAKVKVCVATDLLALTMLTPPGEWGADIVVGSTQVCGMGAWGDGRLGRSRWGLSLEQGKEGDQKVTVLLFLFLSESMAAPGAAVLINRSNRFVSLNFVCNY